uniref:Uncharacterized protein n=1 Tax=Rhizophora mucronata TaxID=61149 RepID=A0A2P2N1J4_RHIMU
MCMHDCILVACISRPLHFSFYDINAETLWSWKLILHLT